MALHPVLAEKLTAALEPARAEPSTARDARLAEVPSKVHAVIGMREVVRRETVRRQPATSFHRC